MRKLTFRSLFIISCLSSILSSCQKETILPAPANLNTASSVTDVSLPGNSSARLLYTTFPETFENGTKTSYATTNVILPSGSWNFNDALIGTLSGDHKVGTKAVRIENTGILTMNFDVTNGVSLVTAVYAKYGSDASSTWALYSSVNAGSTWTQVGNTITAGSTSVNTASFTLNITGNVRFQLRKLSGGRLNIDNFDITNNTSTPPPPDNDNMGMGNPSSAVTDINLPNNYLLIKPQYDLGYNNSKGAAAWVSWHLDLSNIGSTPRCDCFSPDLQLPSTFFIASSSAYVGTGFDRGHQCPSFERTNNSTDNAATFVMSNMLPQAPNLNQSTWAALEDYCITLINSGYELYIYSGGYGTGGTGSNGGITNSVNNGKINVPSHCWKVVVALAIGADDVSRVSTATRVIAVDMPNTQTVNTHTWDYYRISVDAIETSTGFDFLSNVSASIQSVIEASVDAGPTH